MAIAYPPSNERNAYRAPSTFRYKANDEPSSESNIDLVSLLEENARLRVLVVQLSDIVLRNALEQK
jgi:hypothetical protein